MFEWYGAAQQHTAAMIESPGSSQRLSCYSQEADLGPQILQKTARKPPENRQKWRYNLGGGFWRFSGGFLAVFRRISNGLGRQTDAGIQKSWQLSCQEE